MTKTGRPPGEKSRLVSMRVPASKAAEIESFAHSKGMRLAPFCLSLVWMGFDKEKAQALEGKRRVTDL